MRKIQCQLPNNSPLSGGSSPPLAQGLHTTWSSPDSRDSRPSLTPSPHREHTTRERGRMNRIHYPEFHALHPEELGILCPTVGLKLAITAVGNVRMPLVW